jgi:hypothetical protein
MDSIPIRVRLSSFELPASSFGLRPSNFGPPVSKVKDRRSKVDCRKPSSCVLAFLMLSMGWAAGAERVQKQGPASLHIVGGKLDNGRLNIRLSELICVTMRLEGGADLEFQPPATVISSNDWHQVRATPPTLVGPDQRAWEQSFFLFPTRPGDVPLVAEPLRYRQASEKGAWTTVRWKPENIHVVTEIMQADLSEMRHHIRPEELPPASSWRPLFVAAGAFLIMAALTFVGWSRYRRRERPVAAVSPREWFETELKKIEFLPLESPEDIQRFHVYVADAARRYLQLQYDLPALEQTTPEILPTMARSHQISPDQRQRVRDLLEQCDLVKFAGTLPDSEQCRQLLPLARSLLDNS